MSKPTFVRQESRRRKRLGMKWRRPRGVHSKLRLRRRGKPARVSIGYGSPRATRVESVVVFTLDQLKSLTKGIVPILGKVGARKRKELLAEAQKRNITFRNVDVATAMKLIDEQITSRKIAKKARAEKKAAREKKQKEAEKKTESDKKKEGAKPAEKSAEKPANKKDVAKEEKLKETKKAAPAKKPAAKKPAPKKEETKK